MDSNDKCLYYTSQQKLEEEHEYEKETLEKILRKDSTMLMRELREDLTQKNQEELKEVKEEHQKEKDVSVC